MVGPIFPELVACCMQRRVSYMSRRFAKGKDNMQRSYLHDDLLTTCIFVNHKINLQ